MPMKYHSGSSTVGGFVGSYFSASLRGNRATKTTRSPTMDIAKLTSAKRTLGKNGTSLPGSLVFSSEWSGNTVPPNHPEMKEHQQDEQPRDQQHVTGEESQE